MPISRDNILHGYTEYKCQTKDIKEDIQDSIFKAHPSYHTDSGQVSGVWYDWAIVNINGKNSLSNNDVFKNKRNETQIL